MTKGFLRRPGDTDAPARFDDFLAPLPPGSGRHRGTFLLPRNDYTQLKLLLAQLERDSGVQVPVGIFVRLALKAVQPRLEALIKQNRLLTVADVCHSILEAPGEPVG